MNMKSLSSLYSSYRLAWSSAHSNFSDVPSLFSGTYIWICLCMSWSYSDLHQGGSTWGSMHSVLEVMAFTMEVSLVDVVFLALDLCCLMRYGDLRFLGGGGGHGRGGVVGVVMPSLCGSGLRHIIRLDESSLLGLVAYHVVSNAR